MKLAWTTEIVEPNDNHHLTDCVFLHGTGSNSYMWRRQAQFLASKNHRCFLIDLPGHGQSDYFSKDLTLEDYQQVLYETLIDAHVEFPAYFVGHSLGAAVALCLEQKQKGIVKSIFAAALPAKVPTVFPFVLRLLARGPAQFFLKSGIHKFLPWRERTLVQTKAEVLDHLGRLFATLNLFERKLEVSCPIHFASGFFDPVAPFWQTVAMHRLIPGSTLKRFDFGGHNFMDVETKEVNRWLWEHISANENSQNRKSFVT